MENVYHITSNIARFNSVNDDICSSLSTHKMIPSRSSVLYAHDGPIAADLIFWKHLLPFRKEG